MEPPVSNVGAQPGSVVPDTPPAADSTPVDLTPAAPVEGAAPGAAEAAPQPSLPETAIENPFSAERFALDWDDINKGEQAPVAPPPAAPAAAPAPAAPDAQPAAPADTPPADAAPAPAEPAAPVLPELGAMVEQIGGEPVVSAISSLFNAASESPEAATVAGRTFVEMIARQDPLAGNGLLNAVYEQYKDVLGEWYASENGVTPELLSSAKQLAGSGGQAPATPFPEPDTEGYVVVGDEELNLNNSRDKRYYDSLKADHERGLEEQRRATEETAAQARAADEARVRQVQQAEAAAYSFSSERQSNYISEFDKLNLNFGEGKEFFVEAARALGLMQIQHDADFQKQLVAGMDVASRGGEAAQLKATKLDLLARDKIAEISQKFTDHFEYVRRLEAAVNGNLPKGQLPETTQPAVANPSNPPVPPAPPQPPAGVDPNDPWDKRRFVVPAHIFES
jgi:hypothetical protein